MSDHGHARPAPAQPAAAPAPAADPPAAAIVNTEQSGLHEGLQKFLKSLPFVADMAVLLLHIVGMTKLARDVAGVKSQAQAAQSGNVGTTTTQQAQGSPKIADAPFGLSRLSHQDEAQMKRIWDLVLKRLRADNKASLASVFCVLEREVLNTYALQSMLRDVIVSDPDEVKAVDGCLEMIHACQTREGFEAYMYKIGVLTQLTDSENAWKEAEAQRTTSTSASLDRQLAAQKAAWDRLAGWEKTLVRLGIKRL